MRVSAVKQIHIVGESPLVGEYATRCLENNYSVSVRFNPQEKGSLPSGVKKTSTIPKGLGFAIELTNVAIDTKRKNLIALDRIPDIPILSSSVTVTIAEQSIWITNPHRLIGIGALPSLLDGSLIELVAGKASKDIVGTARDFVKSLGKESAFVQDSVGMVMPRILCALANEAHFAMAEGVASASDIDTAMKLGTNYPDGPVEWAEKIGIKHVFAVLSAMYSHFGEERYRIAPALRQAMFNAPLL
jgi:3-hydroxybutyryl-CoA dehydrogenase